MYYFTVMFNPAFRAAVLNTIDWLIGWLSTETIIKYVVYRMLAIAAILFHWITMKAAQQLTGLTQAGPTDRPIRPVSLSLVWPWPPDP